MKPTVENIKAICKDLNEALIKEHLDRLEIPYFHYFNAQDIAIHLKALGTLSHKDPVAVVQGEEDNGLIPCTILAFDHPGVFSLIAGVLASMDFNIHSGMVFTYHPPAPTSPWRKKSLSRDRVNMQLDPLRRRRIIDHFYGHISSDLPRETWIKLLTTRLKDALILLEEFPNPKEKEAKQKVNEMVIGHLATLNFPSEPILYPVAIDVDNESRPFTLIKVRSQDTPAFLYALSTALTLHGYTIEELQIHTHDHTIEDITGILDIHGKKDYGHQ